MSGTEGFVKRLDMIHLLAAPVPVKQCRRGSDYPDGGMNDMQ
jgi:hypothetical protein